MTSWSLLTIRKNLGLAPAIAGSNPDLLKNAWGKRIHDLIKGGTYEGKVEAYDSWQGAVNPLEDPLADVTSLSRSMWSDITTAAEQHNQPGQFTAFIGYEWTSQPGGANMHRNVIYRDGKDLADQVIPFSTYNSIDPEDLWKWMASYEKKTGGRVLAIPHGGNLSNGLMFDDVTLTTKKPIDADYSRRRMKWEPLYEVTQMKGDAEAHPAFSPNDEFADYGTWDRGSFGAVPKTKEMIPKEYMRTALLRGLDYESKLGVNPFKFGVIGSTDSHTSLSTTSEDNFFGKVVILEPSDDPLRFNEVIAGRPAPQSSRVYARETLASGLAAVWARENTREALWDAMSRKEVYATTGTRLKVRVFAGFDFEKKDINRSDFAKYGYEHGVPMGGDLAGNGQTSPSFLIRAIRDADGANLDRVQIIKGWLDGDSKTHERIYDVAVSGDRVIDTDGRCKQPVGNTVNVKDASFTNTIGAPFLQSHWQDPDFDPSLRAFYYVRVIEIPTPRWTTYDANIFGVKLPDDVPTSTQDRAYTSPIWYTPK